MVALRTIDHKLYMTNLSPVLLNGIIGDTFYKNNRNLIINDTTCLNERVHWYGPINPMVYCLLHTVFNDRTHCVCMWWCNEFCTAHFLIILVYAKKELN